VINTDLRGPFLLTREVMPIFEKHGNGKIVNKASIAGIIDYENLSAYCPSKGGIIAMTRSVGQITIIRAGEQNKRNRL
jgi:NAD(P)-dependent dehydrogenase (short-subunit alcohol dehydrogenase family)